MTCYCDLLTPQRILDDDELDVFEQIIPNTDYEYASKRNALWSTFRYRFIGSCDVTSWITVMKDRYSLIMREYDMKLRAFAAMVSSVGTNGADLSASSSESEVRTENEDTPDTAADSTKYLSTRTTVKANGRTYDGLQSVTVRDWMDGVARDPVRDFALEFSDLFVYC